MRALLGGEACQLLKEVPLSTSDHESHLGGPSQTGLQSTLPRGPYVLHMGLCSPSEAQFSTQFLPGEGPQADHHTG